MTKTIDAKTADRGGAAARQAVSGTEQAIIAEAEQAAGKAAAEVRGAEADLAAGRRPLTADALHKLRDNYRHAQLAAAGARAQAERDREAARISALMEVGRQVDERAASNMAGELREILQDIAAAAERVRAITSAWDQSVRELITAASELGARDTPPGGASKAACHLAVRTMAAAPFIIHHNVRLKPVAVDAAQAIEKAVLGHPDDGVLLLNGVQELPGPPRPNYLLRARNGTITALYVQNLDDAIRSQLKTGDLEVLPADEVEAWLRGQLK